MKKLLPLFLLMAGTFYSAFGQEEEIISDTTYDYLAEAARIDSTFRYQYGKIDLKEGIASLTVPEGYKFLDAEQSRYVLTDLWGNPPDESALGLLFPEQGSPILNMSYAIEITYSEDGYIDDEDAQELDYAELLEQMQTDTKESNKARAAEGYPTMELVGWAVSPFYDAENKKLHWAKEIKFEGTEVNTLNYNVRVLGRRGYLMLNVIGDMNVLDEVNQNIDTFLSGTSFNDGHRYSDFNPDLDQVAAYGIGGLIAGKVLAKAGFFVILLKFWKFIAIGAAGLFALLRKKLFSPAPERREIG